MPHSNIVIIAIAVMSILAILLMVANHRKASPLMITNELRTGLLLVQQNNYQQAELHLEQALRMLSNERSPDISKEVSCLVALAQCYQRSGQHEKTRECFRRVISKWERLLGTHESALADIDYAALNSDFAGGTHDVYDFYMNKVIPMRQKMLPEGHPELRGSYVIASRLLRRVGRNSEADEIDQMLAQQANQAEADDTGAPANA